MYSYRQLSISIYRERGGVVTYTIKAGNEVTEQLDMHIERERETRTFIYRQPTDSDLYLYGERERAPPPTPTRRARR